MTRANTRLFLSWRRGRATCGESRGQRGTTTVDDTTTTGKRSRFVDDIPRSIVRTIDKTTRERDVGSEGSESTSDSGDVVS